MWNCSLKKKRKNITFYIQEVRNLTHTASIPVQPKWGRGPPFSSLHILAWIPRLAAVVLKFSAHQNPLKELSKESVPTSSPPAFFLILFQAFSASNYLRCLAVLCPCCTCSVGWSSHPRGTLGDCFQDALQMGKIYVSSSSLCIVCMYKPSLGCLSAFQVSLSQTGPLTSTPWPAPHLLHPKNWSQTHLYSLQNLEASLTPLYLFSFSLQHTSQCLRPLSLPLFLS